MRKEIRPNVIIALLAFCALCVGGYIVYSRAASGSIGTPAGRVVGGRHLPSLGGPAGRASR